MAEPGCQALVQIPRGGMQRATEGFGIGVETVAEAMGHQAADVDDVHPRTGHELEIELYRR